MHCIMGAHFGSVCVYSCKHGFVMEPATGSVRQCTADGWSGIVPACQDWRNPVIEPCPGILSYFSDPLETQTRVYWSVPTARDNSGEKVTVLQLDGPSPGDSLEGGVYSVEYVAIDAVGNTAFCNITILVRVTRCTPLFSDSRLTVSCSHENLRDSVCTFSCEDDGYNLVGLQSTQCIFQREVASWSNPLPSCTDRKNPVFRNCPSSKVVIAENNRTTSVVLWPTPIATDNARELIVVNQTQGNQSGSEFTEGTHTVSYSAIDFAGNHAFCAFNISVKVIRCPDHSPDGLLQMKCSGNILGSVCRISCTHGYRVEGLNYTQCQRGSTDNEGIWSNQLSTCIDNSDPVFVNIPLSREVYAEPTRTTASVVWEPPTVEDEEVGLAAVQIAGPDPGTTLDEGVHWIVYRTEDSAGNYAEYTFNITVIVLRCDEPETDPGLQVECDHGRLSGSSCSFSCPLGFNVIGSQTVTCVGNSGSAGSAWNTSFPSCEVLTCSGLEIQPLVSLSGCTAAAAESPTYGTECLLSCPAGYIGVGEPMKICQSDGSWSTRGFECQKRPCERLPPIPFLSFSPANCVISPEYGDVCSTTCTLPGYELDPIELSEIRCTENGTWDQELQEISCRDAVPPVIESCPKSFTVSLTESRGVEVTFDLPTARDNSNRDPVVITSPQDLTSPYNITNDTTVSFTFYDESHNSAVCTFNISIKEELPVDLLFCPDDILVESSEKVVNVSWDRPRFADEGGENVHVINTLNSTQLWALFHSGHSQVIEYTAVNAYSGTETVCRFSVTVQSSSCPPLEPPVNGALSCRRWPFSEFCSMSCDSGFDIPRVSANQNPPNMYVCGSSKEWKPTSVVPDCSTIRNPRRRNLPANLTFYTGDCTEVATHEQIALSLTSLIRSSPFSHICKESAQECSIQHVTVTCGPLDIGSLPPARLSRRSVRHFSLKDTNDQWSGNVTLVSFQISFDSDRFLDFGEQESFAVDAMQRHLFENLTVKKKNDSRGRNEEELRDPVLSLGDLDIECDEGFVSQTSPQVECVACPRGHYFMSQTQACIPCHSGFYQEQEAAVNCKSCPPGRSTAGEGANGIEACLDRCPPGYSSPTGLAPCFPCDAHSYQPDGGRSSCEPCPPGQKTGHFGAVSDTDCQP